MQMADKVMANIRATVELYGQAVLFIGAATRSDQPFHYTIGRGKRGLPELLIIAPLHPDAGKRMLNELDRLMPEKRESGSLVTVGGKYPVKLVDTEFRRASQFTLLATHYFHRGDYQVQQVILCDPEGKFPPDCAAPYDQQPNLGL